MQKSTKRVLGVAGICVVAAASGYVGAGLSSGSESGGVGGPQGSFIDDIKDRGELRVGVAIAAPMTVQGSDGTLGGPNLIPLRALADQLGVELKPVAAEWKNIVAGLQADRYDFAANLDYTVERSLAIQFTDPVYEYQAVYVVKADSPHTTAEQIRADGGAVATAQGSAPEKAVQETGLTVMPVDNYSNALSALQAGRVIAEFADLPTAEAQTLADPSLKIVVPTPPIYSASAAYGIPADTDTRSLQIINIAIERARESGELARAYADVDYHEIDDLGDLVKK
ncbi:substrate-binding periplasmic protein [Rhodococcus sp. NPDC057529]|uniref:substrate-binding periplasmic protein n=1 Tax=Rhodococcus sp. NPDC057529 TaxID=3346158 RepID=UPI00366CF47A